MSIRKRILLVFFVFVFVLGMIDRFSYAGAIVDNKKVLSGSELLQRTLAGKKGKAAEKLVEKAKSEKVDDLIIEALKIEADGKTIKKLIELGADVNEKNGDGLTPLIFLITDN